MSEPLRVDYRGALSRGGADLHEGPPPWPDWYVPPDTPWNRLEYRARLDREAEAEDPAPDAAPDPKPKRRVTVKVPARTAAATPSVPKRTTVTVPAENAVGARLAQELRARGVPSARWWGASLTIDPGEQARADAILDELRHELEQ
jgi:hypothetical protein